MNDSVVVALVAFPASMLTAGSVFLSAWNTNKKSRNQTKELSELHGETQDSLTEIHILVNDRLDAALKRIFELEQALMEVGLYPPEKEK